MGRVGGQFRGGRGGGQYRGGRGGGQFRGGRRGSRGRRDQQHQQRAGKLRTRDQTGAGSWECDCGYSNWSCRNDLGEKIFPLVEKIRPDLARKITGMMEDPTSLKGKVRPDTSFIVVSLVHPNTLLQVEEAVDVLQKNKEENMIE